MSEPKVSIVIPVYNVENYLRPCIESALAQTLADIEVIIVDDGSTDSCPAIIDYYASQDDRVRAVHKENEGYGKACNVGMGMAKGEYVAILESDDFVDPEMYESLYEHAKRFDADVVKAPYNDCFLKGVIKPYPHNDYLTSNMPRERLYSLSTCACQLAVHQSIWSGVYRRSYLEENAIRFDEVPGAGHVDIKFCVESLVYSDRLAWLDQPHYNYRVEREGSSTAEYSPTENVERYRQMHDFFKAFGEKFRAAAPQLVTREAVGCYRYFKKCDFSAEDFAAFRSLLLDFTEGEIMRAPIISHADKEELLLVRNEPEVARKAVLAEKERARAKKGKKQPSHAGGAKAPTAKAGGGAPQKASRSEQEKELAVWTYRMAVLGGLATCCLSFEAARSESAPVKALAIASAAATTVAAGAFIAAFLSKASRWGRKRYGKKLRKVFGK